RCNRRRDTPADRMWAAEAAAPAQYRRPGRRSRARSEIVDPDTAGPDIAGRGQRTVPLDRYMLRSCPGARWRRWSTHLRWARDSPTSGLAPGPDSGQDWKD